MAKRTIREKNQLCNLRSIKKETPKKTGPPKPLRRRGCERKRWDKKGGDVPGGIRDAGCWG